MMATMDETRSSVLTPSLGSDDVAPETRHGRRPLIDLPLGWPLVALFGGFPLWWVLGLSGFCSLVFAVPMATYLFRQGHVRVPRGFGMWLLFLFWVVGGIFVLQVHAPGSVASHGTSRYFTFVLRFLWYVAATVVGLYVLNTRKELSSEKICLALSYMFVVVTFGGILGILAPRFQFRSALEYVLPGRLGHNGFVLSMIHPVTAQVQDFLGYQEARPSAPFAYTNAWGLAIACFLPFFIITWCPRDAGWRRLAAPPILLLAVVATILSLNRGLWIALIASAIFVAVRLAIAGRAKMIVALVAAALLAAGLIVFSPLGGLVLDRFAHPDSNQGRTNLGSLTVSSVLEGSPIIGFGTTRNVLGNFQSIAAAASTACPGCSPPPLGTQGHLWLVVFSQGFVGLFLYVGFFLTQLVRHVRCLSPPAVAACTVLLVHLVTMPVYDTIGPSLFAIFAAVGLLARADEDARDASRAARRSVRGTREVTMTLDGYVQFARRHIGGILVAMLLGALAGGLFQLSRDAQVTASQSILLPASALSTDEDSGVTIDSDAQLVASDPVLDAIAKADGTTQTHAQLADRLQITASPNTRILHIAFTADNARAAIRGVEAATSTYLRERAEITGSSPAHSDPGEIVRAATVQLSRDPWKIAVTAGVMVSVGLMLLYWRLVGDGRMRVRRPGTLTKLTGLPVFAVVRSRTDDAPDRALLEVANRLAQQSVSSVIAAPSSVAARDVAWQLDEGLVARGLLPRNDAVIVASTRTRADELTRLHFAASLSGQRVIGAVLVEEK